MRPRVLAFVSSAVLGGLVVAGMFAAGSPGTARKFEADQARVGRLSELHHLIENHRRTTGQLPASLAELQHEAAQFSPEFDPRRDPETDEFFEYALVGERTYRICANFYTDSSDRRDTRYYVDPGYHHPAGRHCFTKNVIGRFDEPGPLIDPPVSRQVPPFRTPPVATASPEGGATQ